MRDEQPKPLFTLLQRILFVEQRRCGFGKFFDEILYDQRASGPAKQTGVHGGNH